MPKTMTKPTKNKQKSKEDAGLTCSVCNESFDSEQELRNHQKSHHSAAMSGHHRGQKNVSAGEAAEDETAA